MLKANGLAHVTLTVSDLSQTKKFYETLFETRFELDNAWSFNLRKVGIACWFVQWTKDKSQDKFDERRIGLDHIAFKVDSLPELEKIIARLNHMGVANAGLERFHGKYPYVAFRDPDNIQTEFFIPQEL